MAFVKLSSPIQTFLIKLLGDDKKDFISISLKWHDVVGDYLADNSYVFDLEKDVLFVGVANGVVMQELNLIKESLMNKISQQLKIRLKKIVFFIKDDAHRN